MPHIYHIASKQDWEKAKEETFYSIPSLKDEGLIHCCMEDQVSGILNRYYNDIPDIVILTIDTEKLRSQLVYEWSPSLEATFPHIYGPINTDCVISVKEL
jgi:uncharacterized protein (DUF952 family)